MLGLGHELRSPLAVSLGAIAGALSRYYLTLWSVQQFGPDFPYGTWMINCSGCGVMGLVMGYGKLPPDLHLLITTGFLGAYTTFSTYGLDTVRLAQSGKLAPALLYWLSSAGVGVLCLLGGMSLGQALHTPPRPGP